MLPSALARQKAEAQPTRQALVLAGGNLSCAAEFIGITRPTLYDRVEKQHIDPTQFARVLKAILVSAISLEISDVA